MGRSLPIAFELVQPRKRRMITHLFNRAARRRQRRVR